MRRLQNAALWRGRGLFFVTGRDGFYRETSASDAASIVFPLQMPFGLVVIENRTALLIEGVNRLQMKDLMPRLLAGVTGDREPSEIRIKFSLARLNVLALAIRAANGTFFHICLLLLAAEHGHLKEWR
jgi:hypothetical protein